MHRKTLRLRWRLLGALGLLLASGCVHPDPLPRSASTPDPEPGTALAKLHEKNEPPPGDELSFNELTQAYGLKVSIDLVTGRRVCRDGKNEVIVVPSSKQLVINGKAYPLEGMVRWRQGKLFLPGDAGPYLAEHLRPVALPEVVANDPDEFDGRPPVVQLTSATARASARPKSGGTLPAAWQVKGERRWRYIVIHHSATDSGDAGSFHRTHQKKWTNGLGYHFVVGNGSQSGDGEVQVGPRWTRQGEGIDGAHAGSKQFNQLGIGICLVGDFNQARPTPSQLVTLRRLCRTLMRRYGITADRIYPHCNVRKGHTECPGKHFPFETFLRSL